MATKVGGYHLKDGSRVPSVTTIIGRFKESGALIHWAAGQSAKYVAENCPDNPSKADIVKLCDQAKNAYRDVRDAAAEAGTLAHEAVEAWIRKQPYAFAGNAAVVEKAEMAYGNFLEWAGQTSLEITHAEVPLISEKHKFGGTLDAMLISGKRSLGDWKSSNAVYGDYLVQIAAYGILWEENFPEMPIEGGYHLMRFDKTFGDYHHHAWSELESAKKSFLLMRELFELDKELKLRAK